MTAGRTGCGVAGCAGRHYARGYCRPHYTRWRRHGHPQVSIPIRRPETVARPSGIEIERAIWLYDHGVSGAGIAARLGTSPSAIYRALHAHNVRIRTRESRSRQPRLEEDQHS